MYKVGRTERQAHLEPVLPCKVNLISIHQSLRMEIGCNMLNHALLSGVPQGMVQHATPQAIPGDKQVVTPGVTQNAAHTIPICPVYRTMPTSFDSMPPPPNLMPPMVPGNLGPQFLMSGNQMPYSEPVYPPTSMAAPPTQQQEQQQQQQFVSINNAGMPIMPAYADGCAPPLPQNFANDSPRQPQSLSQKLTPPSRASSVSISVRYSYFVLFSL